MTVLNKAETPTPLPGLHEVCFAVTPSEYRVIENQARSLKVSPTAFCAGLITQWVNRQKFLKGHFDRSESQS